MLFLFSSEQKRRAKAAKKAQEKEEKAKALAAKQGEQGAQQKKKPVAAEDEETLDPRVSWIWATSRISLMCCQWHSEGAVGEAIWSPLHIKLS